MSGALSMPDDSGEWDVPDPQPSAGVPGGQGALSARSPDAQRQLSMIDAAMARMQQAREMRDIARAGGVNMPLLAAAGALLAPTRTGSIGESLGNAFTASAPILAQQRQADETRDLRESQQDWSMALQKAQLENAQRTRDQAEARDANRMRIEDRRDERIREHQRRMEELATRRIEGADKQPKLEDRLITNPETGKQEMQTGWVTFENGQPTWNQFKGVGNKTSSINPNATGDPDAELSDEAAKIAAQGYLKGNPGAMTNIGRGKQGPKNVAKVYKYIGEIAAAEGMTGSDVAANRVDLQGQGAAARSAGTRGANVDIALAEAIPFANLALDASKKVDRTQFPTFNSLLQAVRRGTGDESVVQLQAATNSFLNAYARTVTPVGVTTEGAQHRARELLDMAWSQGQYEAGIRQLQLEMDAAQKAPGIVRQHILDNIKNNKFTPLSPTEVQPNRPAEPSPQQPKKLPMPSDLKDTSKLDKDAVYETPYGDFRWTGSGWRKAN